MWEPTEEYKKETQLYKFQQALGIQGGYEELWKYSVDHSDEFWPQLLDYLGVIYQGSTNPTKLGDTMPDVQYFPNVQLNFAENLLKHGAPDDERWTFAQLREDAARVAVALEQLRVTSEDAVGAYMPNIAETVIAMLGTTSTGAVWSSVSPDFGPQAVADRFSQIEPKVLFHEWIRFESFTNEHGGKGGGTHHITTKPEKDCRCRSNLRCSHPRGKTIPPT